MSAKNKTFKTMDVSKVPVVRKTLHQPSKDEVAGGKKSICLY